jgi:hypothetical protein
MCSCPADDPRAADLTLLRCLFSCSSQSGEPCPPRVPRAPAVWSPRLEPQPGVAACNILVASNIPRHKLHVYLAMLAFLTQTVWARQCSHSRRDPRSTRPSNCTSKDTWGLHKCFIPSVWFVLSRAQRFPTNRCRCLLFIVLHGAMCGVSLCRSASRQRLSPSALVCTRVAQESHRPRYYYSTLLRPR